MTPKWETRMRCLEAWRIMASEDQTEQGQPMNDTEKAVSLTPRYLLRYFQVHRSWATQGHFCPSQLHNSLCLTDPSFLISGFSLLTPVISSSCPQTAIQEVELKLVLANNPEETISHHLRVMELSGLGRWKLFPPNPQLCWW